VTAISAGKARAIAAAVLFCLAAAYLARGLYFLVLKPEHKTVDLWASWVNVQYVMHGIYPHQVRYDEAGLPWPSRSGSAGAKVDITSSSYPPWSYLTGMLFYGLPWRYQRLYSCAVNLVMLALICAWAFRLTRPYGRPAGVLAVACVLAMGGVCRTLGSGQMGILIVGLLIAAIGLTENGMGLAGGLVLGMALAKVTISGLFILPFLARKQFRALAAAAAYVLLAYGVACAFTGVDPLTAGRLWLRTCSELGPQGAGLVRFVITAGMPSRCATFVTLAVAACAGSALLFAWRRSSLATQLAIAAVAGRLWSYHRDYDDVMLVFLLVALALNMFRRGDRLSVVAFGLAGVSLWAPGRIVAFPAFQVFQIAAWVLTLAYLLTIERPASRQNTVGR
jgi:hypothetical protein